MKKRWLKMKDSEKYKLKYYCRIGYSKESIKRLINCSESTIKKYMKIFSKHLTNKK